MRFSALAVFLLLIACAASQPVVVVASEPKLYAWWLRTTFFPYGKALRGHAVGQLNPNWCAIDELRAEIFPNIEEVQSSESGIRDSQATFALTLKMSGHVTEVVLAIYRACTGETGTALIALEGGSGGTDTSSTVLSVQSLNTPAQWATIHILPEGDIEVWWCFECDNTARYRWNERSKIFELLSDRHEGSA